MLSSYSFLSVIIAFTNYAYVSESAVLEDGDGVVNAANSIQSSAARRISADILDGTQLDDERLMVRGTLLPEGREFNLNEAIQYPPLQVLAPAGLVEPTNLMAMQVSQFRKILYGSPLLEKTGIGIGIGTLLDIVQDICKCKHYNQKVVNNLHEEQLAAGASAAQRPPRPSMNELATTKRHQKRRIAAKREAIFSVEQNVEGPKILVNVGEPVKDPYESFVILGNDGGGGNVLKFYGTPTTSISNYSEYVPRDSLTPPVCNSSSTCTPSQLIELSTGHFNDDADVSSTSATRYAPEARFLLPHLHLFTHPPYRPPTHGSGVAGSLRPPRFLRPPILRPVIRPLVAPATLLPIIRAFADPTVIRSLLEAIPRIPPIIPPRVDDQIIHPPVTSYYSTSSSSSSSSSPMSLPLPPAVAGIYATYQKPSVLVEDNLHVLPAASNENRPLSPLVDSFSTLLQEFSITR